MHTPCVDDVVQLATDIPELLLHRGAVGIVCSTWLAPITAYEVEFEVAGQRTRALLLSQEVRPLGELAAPLT